MKDVTVVGGGIVGLATAYTLLESGKASVRLLEKEVGVARHQSTHNSGVLHAGLQYQPGSEKARLAREGIRRMTEFCVHHAIPHEICGKLVVAVTDAELGRLDAMLERGRQNGLQGLRRLGPEQAREIEPHVRCLAAIHVPEEGIVDYAAVCAALEREIEARGGEILVGAGVRGLRRERGWWHLETPAGEFTSRVLVNCAGLHADRIAEMAGEHPGCRIVPFRGEYQRLRPGRDHLVRHLLYPLPEPGFPFLGVHFTRRIEGGIDAGPNAVLAFAREGYTLTTVDLGDLAEALTFPGLWRFGLAHPRMVARELAQSVDRRRFIAAARRLVPEIADDDFIPGGASGVRAQAMLPDGRLLDDFLWVEAEGAVHVVNAPSPAATASLAIAQEVAGRALSRLAQLA
ncbi:MAG TPA: L-2-hydroxyglutarate oxidase [Longimicrobiales bacterium]|nr:L-2-hydroxyglutarate oxidase [Longimicrobiales bacterium]